MKALLDNSLSFAILFPPSLPSFHFWFAMIIIIFNSLFSRSITWKCSFNVSIYNWQSPSAALLTALRLALSFSLFSVCILVLLTVSFFNPFVYTRVCWFISKYVWIFQLIFCVCSCVRVCMHVEARSWYWCLPLLFCLLGFFRQYLTEPRAHWLG